MKEEVILLDFWVSPFAIRAKIALEEKGVKYEIRDEDLLGTKSELLLKLNPVYRKVPVLIHNGKGVSESGVIVSYIEDTWPSPPLLPSCSYERAQARFWADYIDKKLFDAGNNLWKTKGDELEAARKEFIDILKVLEGVLGEKDFFGGDSFGYVDIIAIPLIPFFHAYEQFGSFKVEEECPRFTAWVDKCKERDSVCKLLPDSIKVYEFVRFMKKRRGFD